MPSLYPEKYQEYLIYSAVYLQVGSAVILEIIDLTISVHYRLYGARIGRF